MSARKYRWKRFWVPREGNIRLSNDGFLSDPETKWGGILNPDAVPFTEIDKYPCLILLGEPGIGKSTAIEDAFETIGAGIDSNKGRILKLNLNEYSSDARLAEDLFNCELVREWKTGDYNLHIFLDSYDECRLNIKSLAPMIMSGLRGWPVDRLHLRIACRTAVWPESLENGFKDLWGDSQVGIYELAPLRRVDVEEAAREEDIDPVSFLEEIDRVGAAPLTIKPVTLRFLLDSYRRNGKFPQGRRSLYLAGCRGLCEEVSASRRDAGLTGSLDAEQRLMLAARIAAVMIFSNRAAICIGAAQVEVRNTDITLQEMSGGYETIRGNRFEVHETLLREVLDTGLFTSRGPNCMGWAHQTYAEFLAAHYLVSRGASFPQTMNLITCPGDPEQKVVPQLHESVAWLAGMSAGIFGAVLSADPAVLVKSDVATADEADRRALLEALLESFAKGKLHDFRFSRKNYAKLAHTGIADQIHPFIVDGTMNLIARRAAIDIAHACRVVSLQDELLNISLDPMETLAIRDEAASAVADIADGATKSRMKPLAFEEIDADSEDQLKGHVLKALWPGHLTAKKLFAALSYPKHRNFMGSYRYFLGYELIPHLSQDDLPVAMKWIDENKLEKHDPLCPFVKLADAIMLKAWEHLESTGVLALFAKVAWSRMKNHDEIVGGDGAETLRQGLRADDAKRRRLIEAMFPLMSDVEHDPVLLVISSIALIQADETLWLLDRLSETKSDREQRILAKLLFHCVNWQKPEQVEPVLIAAQGNRILQETLAPLICAVERCSPQAVQLKEQHAKIQELERGHLERKDRRRKRLNPPPAKRVAHWLEACEAGAPDAWWRLNRDLTLEAETTEYDYGCMWETDITALPGWRAADRKTKSRIIKVAKRYLSEKEPDPAKWIGAKQWTESTLAEYRPFPLLRKEAPELFTTLPPEIWKKWAPAVFCYPQYFSDEGGPYRQEIFKMAYAQAPEEILKIVALTVGKEGKEGGCISIVERVEPFWDNRIADTVLETAKDNRLKAEAVADLLTVLLRNGSREAKSFAESLATISDQKEGNEREKGIAAGRVLMANADDAGWPALWPVVQREPGFGRDLLLSFAHTARREDGTFERKLTELELGELYVWLEKNFPRSEDPKHEGAHLVGPREALAWWRRSLPEYLVKRGTSEACEAIRNIMTALPELDWLRWTLLDAQDIARRASWTAPHPEHIRGLVEDKHRRLVQDGSQLLDVVLESLLRYQDELHSETLEVDSLWNEYPAEKKAGKRCRPKDERKLSNHVKKYLERDLKHKGIIVNREVEIHHGEQTDIHVEAIAPTSNGDSYDRLRVIIEVKGCWNKALDVDMENQLVGRYLKNNPDCRHGVYLIGWFNCDKWDSEDYRKAEAKKQGEDITVAREKFDTQATSLSQGNLQVKAFVVDTSWA